MLKRIARLFNDLSYDVGIRADFSESMFGNFAASEPLDLARGPETWGHLRHSLSIFFAGYVVLNYSQRPLTESEIMDDLGLSEFESVNKVWFITSAFHDCAVFLEHLPFFFGKIIDNSNLFKQSLSRCYLNRKSSPENLDLSSISSVDIQYQTLFRRSIQTICDKMGKVGLYSEITKYIKNRIDHGLLAGVNLFNSLADLKFNEQISLNACYPILLHNMIGHKSIDLTGKGNFIVQLLCLFDRFQAWGRENLYEGFFDGTVIEKVVLRKFELGISARGEKEITMEIDYLPFRFISPIDATLQEKEIKIIQITRNQYDVLDQIGVKKSWKLI